MLRRLISTQHPLSQRALPLVEKCLNLNACIANTVLQHALLRTFIRCVVQSLRGANNYDSVEIATLSFVQGVHEGRGLEMTKPIVNVYIFYIFKR